MRFDKVLALNAIDASVASTTSKAIDCSYHVACSFQVIATGTAVGVAKLQVSNDGVTFADLPGGTVAVTGVGSFIFPKIDISYYSLQIVYTKTSGTGTITATYKSIGF